MEVKLEPFNFAKAASRAGMPQVAQRVSQATAPAEGASFSSVLTNALRSVSDTQNNATRLQREVSLDNPKVGIEETMIAMQKSQVSFQAAIQVRNRLVQAYSDIMNMQV
jgi:flagellar hook-basal body complex protein FliE